MATAVKTRFVPQSPIQLVRPSGSVRDYGYGATTDAERGAALDAALAAATDGDIIRVRGDAACTTSIRKTGVRVVPESGSVITNTADLPIIDISDLSTGHGIIYRGREANLYASEDRFCLWSFGFDTTANYANTVYSTSGPTLTIGGGKGVYASAGGTTSASFIASPHIPVAQYAASVLIDSHNASSGASYNDVFVGFALTTTATSDTLQYKLGAIYRHTDSLNQVFLHYEHSGGGVETTPVTITESQPFRLVYVINHNSATAAIIRQDGSWQVIDHQEITLTHLDMEDAATVAKMRPLLFFQSNGVQATTVKDWWVRNMGTFGEREHMVVRYENGEPIKSPEGFYYISVDDIGPNTASTASNGPNTAYMRCTHGIYVLDPKTGRRVRTSAKFYMKIATRVFGTQEGFFMHDRSTGLWHVWFSEWNYSGGSAAKLYHGSSFQSPLEIGSKVYELGELTHVNLSSLTGFSSQAVYSTNVRKINGTWYLTGVVTGGPYGRSIYLISDDNPDFSSPTLVFHNAASTNEGGYFWHVGSNWYVSAGVGDHVEAWDFAGNSVYSHAFPGAGRYDPFMDLLEVVEGGQTKYIFLTFSDTPGGAHGEDYYDGVAYNPVAFGSRLLIDGGTFVGEQYTETAK